MAWKILKVSLAISDTNIDCKGGKSTATITVSGETDDVDVINHFNASLRDDHVIPDILWKSGQQSAAAGETIMRNFETDIWCNKRCKVVGPAGSSHEKTAELYAYVVGEELESQSGNIPVSCC